MKAWFDSDGFIHVSAQTAAEKFALRWNREHLRNADANGIVLHEDEPTSPTACDNETYDREFNRKSEQ